MNAWIPFFSTLLGGALALLGTILVKSLESRRERRALALAFAGEISAILEIVKEREYVRYVGEYIADAEMNKDKVVTMRVGVEQDFFTVYHSNAAKIGLLPKASARQVACFYSFGKSLIEDLTSKRQITDPAVARAHLHQIQTIMRKFVEIGTNAVMELEKA